MKKIYRTRKVSLTGLRNWLLAGAIVGAVPLAGQTYTFTTAGITGSVGPTQGQANTAYASTNLNNLVSVANGIQSFTIPATGTYVVTAYGAQGGNANSGGTGGLGSRIKGEFFFTANTVIDIVVGQRGENGNTTSSGGGAGGSGVRQGATLLIVAGGGGGGGQNGGNGVGAGATNNGNSSSTGAITGGTGGNGGNAVASNGGGCGGGGYLTIGAKPSGGTPNLPGPGGFAAQGGMRSIWCGGTAGAGGFGVGGGAGGEGMNGGAGGGGGYSGGAGGEWGNSGWCSNPAASGGGGGGSYNIGTSPVNTGTFNSGEGMVVLEYLCDVVINGNKSICMGGSTTLTTTAVGNILWSTGSTIPTVTLAPQTTTQYTMTGNGTINNCVASIVFSIIVHPLPTIVATVNPPLLCVGSEATVTAQGASTYTWSGGAPSGSMTTVSPSITAQYSVSGTSTAGCINTLPLTVNVNALQLSISGSSAICTGKTGSLTGSGGTNLSWVNFGGFPTISPMPSVTTVYTLTGIDANNCTLTQTAAIVVNPNPTVMAQTTKTLVCRNSAVTLTATGASNYVWSPSAGSAVTSVVQVTPAINTDYYYSVTGTDANGCVGSSTLMVRAELCTGIAELNASGQTLSVYPNPNNGSFYLKGTTGTVILASDIMGRLVGSWLVPDNGQLEISNLPKGIYTLSSKDRNITPVRVVVE